ncbi:MAG: hypothetical protein V3U76_01685 [Granulosicoccus sp.]
MTSTRSTNSSSKETQLNSISQRKLRDSVDLRDVFYRPALLSLPSGYQPTFLNPANTRSFLKIRDQGISTQCTGYALAALIDIQRYAKSHTVALADSTAASGPVSARMLFEMGAAVSAETSGTGQRRYSLRSALKGFYHNGVCLESSWRNDQDKDSQNLDLIACHKQARRLSLGAYFRLQHHLADYHSAITEAGAILVSAQLHEGWQPDLVATNGRILLTDNYTEYGAHAFVIVGYNETGFYVLNSWGPAWAGNIDNLAKVPGIAHWSYEDWAESVMDAWVLRLAVPTPGAFEYSVGAQGTTYFGSANAGIGESSATTSISVPRQHVLGHYIHFESGRYVETGSYPDSDANLQRTLEYIKQKFIDEECSSSRQIPPANDSLKRIYLRVTGDTGSVKNAMQRIAKLRRYLRPKGVYPISIVWTARMASAFAVGIKACMAEAVARMPDPSDDRNDLIESLIRPLGRPLWNQLKQEAVAVANPDAGCPGPLVKVLRHLNSTLDRRHQSPHVSQAVFLPERRIELVVEGAGALVFVEFLRQAGAETTDLLRHVNRIHLAYPVANHDYLLRVIKNYKQLCIERTDSISGFNDLTQRITIVRPNSQFLDKSSIGPYTRTWFDLVNNSFESEPTDEHVRNGLSLATSETHLKELALLGISTSNDNSNLRRQSNGAAILRNAVVSKEFIAAVLDHPAPQSPLIKTRQKPPVEEPELEL